MEATADRDIAAAVALTRVRALVRTGSARSIRLAADLSLSEVARSLDVSAAAVSRWEAGERVPRGGAALRYGQLLDALLGKGAGRT